MMKLSAVALTVIILTTVTVQARLTHESNALKSPFVNGWLQSSTLWNTADPPRHPHDRRLQTVPIPPTRTCGQDLGITSAQVISSLIQSLGQAFGNVTLDQNIQYDVQAIVHCASCDDVATTELLADTEGFNAYCAPGSYGSNVTHSGLLLLPIDPTTNEIIANQKLKGSVFCHSIAPDTSNAPSEVFPEDLAGFLENAPDPAVAIGSLYNVLGGLIAASSGVVSLVPDYIGFGQSSFLTKSLGSKLYRQATIPLWLQAQSYISNTTNGCTQLDNVATVGGYSEGGISSFAIALALYNDLGVTVLSCNSGAASFDVIGFLQWHLREFDSGTVEPIVAIVMAYIGVVLSSTDPDLANSNVGQDLLLQEWMDESDFAKWAQGWISSDLDATEIATFIPFPDYVSMLNPNITEMIRNATMMNITDPCTLAVEGETDKFCEVAKENDLTDEVADPPFPVVLCHSPQDELIPYALAPNVSSSDNLSEFSLVGITASGSHGEAALFCFFPMVLPFTIFNTGPSAIEQVPIDSCAATPTQDPDGTTPTEAPPPDTPTELPPPTQAPSTESTSTGYRVYGSFFTLALVPLVWSVVGF